MPAIRIKKLVYPLPCGSLLGCKKIAQWVSAKIRRNYFLGT